MCLAYPDITSFVQTKALYIAYPSIQFQVGTNHMLHILYYTAILNDPKRIFRETPEFIVRIVLLPQLDVVLHFFFRHSFAILT